MSDRESSAKEITTLYFKMRDALLSKDVDSMDALMSRFERATSREEALENLSTCIPDIITNDAGEGLERILSKYPELLKLGGGGKMMLKKSCETGATKVTDVLLRKGVDPNDADDLRDWALAKAVAENRPDCLRLLLEAGGDPNKEVQDNGKDISLLHLAVLQDTTECTEILLAAGIDIEKLNGMQKTAIEIAQITGQEEQERLIKSWEEKKRFEEDIPLKNDRVGRRI